MAKSSTDLAALLQGLQQPGKPDIWQALAKFGADASNAGRLTVGRPAEQTLGGALGGFAQSLQATRQQDQANKIRQLQTLSAVQQLKAVDKKQKRQKAYEENKPELMKSIAPFLSKFQLEHVSRLGDVDEVNKFVGEAATADKSGKLKKELFKIRADLKSGGGLFSAKTEIQPDGSTIQAAPNGEVIVRNPGGEVVTGQKRLEVLENAKQFKLNMARTTSGEKAAGTAAIARSEKAITSLSKIKTSITNIDQAINLIDKGAQSGPIISRLPSVRSASIALDNVQKAMGLDVVQSTTFGALSEGELELALNKALPTRLPPKELRKWLVEKKAAQEKLAGYLENAAIFLGIPGNTSADWIAQQKELQESSPENLPTATNSETGEKLIFKDGKWQAP